MTHAEPYLPADDPMENTQLIFRQELARETLLGERARAILLSGLYAALLGLLVVYQRMLGDPFRVLDPSRVPTDLILMLLAVAAGYELLVWVIFGLMFRSRRRIRTRFSYVNTLIEISIPTAAGVVLVILSQGGLPVLPAGLIYLLFVALSVLRLDFWLSLFTGVVAAGEYLALAWVSGQLYSGQFGIALVLVFSGIVSGFVAGQIDRRVQRALGAIDRRKRLTGIFGQHVSRDLTRRLLDQQPTGISRKRRQVAVMLLNIPEFTAFAAVRTQEQLVEYLDALVELMLDSIQKNGGAIFRYLGSGFLAAFDDAFTSGDPRQKAVVAAHEIISRLNARISAGSLQPIQIHIGVHAGQAVTGNLRTPPDDEYGIQGDLIHLTAQITLLNRKVGSQLLISDPIWETAKEHYAGVQISPLSDEQTGQRVGLHRLV